MAAKPDQRREFGARLASLRAAAGKSQRAVTEHLADFGGRKVTVSALSEWERGLSAPDAENVQALERMFDEPAGSLAGLLGLRGDDPAMEARVRVLEVQMQELIDLVRQLDKSPGAPE